MNKQKLVIAFFVILHTNMLHSMDHQDSSNFLVIDKSRLPRLQRFEYTEKANDEFCCVPVQYKTFFLLLAEAHNQAQKESRPVIYELLDKIKNKIIITYPDTNTKEDEDSLSAEENSIIFLTPKDYYYRLLTNIYKLGNPHYITGSSLYGPDSYHPTIIGNKLAYLVEPRELAEFPKLKQDKCKPVANLGTSGVIHLQDFSENREISFLAYKDCKAVVKKIVDNHLLLSDKRP